MAYSREYLLDLYNGAIEKKDKYEKLKKIEESLTTIKAIISSSQLSFEMSDSNISIAISAVPDGIISDVFTEDYLPIMEENKSLVGNTIEENAHFIENTKTAIERVEEDIIKVHDNYIKLVDDLGLYRASYIGEITADGLYESTCINK